jgi:hypothetical protein
LSQFLLKVNTFILQVILDGVDGNATAGRLLAIMGPVSRDIYI